MNNLIIIPTYNERDNITNIISDILRLYPSIMVLVVDDNSPDGTAEIVSRLKRKYKNLSVMKRLGMRGFGASYLEAFSFVKDNKELHSIITMDADGSHDPAYVIQMLEKIKLTDLVIGSRYVKGGGVSNWSYYRKIISFLGNYYARVLLRIGVKDLTSGFMCINRKLLKNICDKIDRNINGFSFLMLLKYELIRNNNIKFEEIPIIFTERRVGSTKFSPKIFIEGFFTPMRILFNQIFK